jgi:hypothetical protein
MICCALGIKKTDKEASHIDFLVVYCGISAMTVLGISF